MTKKWIFLGTLLALLLLISNCEKLWEKRLGGKELVKINNVSISQEEFDQMVERQPLEGKMKLLNKKGLKDFLENYVIAQEVLYQEAKKKGIDKKKEIVVKVEDFRRAMVIDALLENELRGKSEVLEADIQQYYRENEDRFSEPKEVKIRHIFITSESLLKEAVMRLSKGENFAKLASIYNVDKSREDGGSLGYIKRGQLAPPFAQFEEAAFSLREKGDISDVIKTPRGYHIIQMEDKQGTALKPFDQVKEKIRSFLQGKKRQEAYLNYVKEAKSRAKILVNEKLWDEKEEKKELKPSPEEKK